MTHIYFQLVIFIRIMKVTTNMYVKPKKPSVELHVNEVLKIINHQRLANMLAPLSMYEYNTLSKERTNNTMTQNELSHTISSQLNDSHDEFHEINSKLYSVIGMLQDTDDNDFNNTIIDYIKSAIKAVELADGLIDNAQAVHFG